MSYQQDRAIICGQIPSQGFSTHAILVDVDTVQQVVLQLAHQQGGNLDAKLTQGLVSGLIRITCLVGNKVVSQLAHHHLQLPCLLSLHHVATSTAL